jgi:hypothetical protein
MIQSGHSLFDHLVGAGEQRRRHGDAEWRNGRGDAATRKQAMVDFKARWFTCDAAF